MLMFNLFYIAFTTMPERLNHHHLYIFWTFSRTGSFTGTAEALSIAQSAVTSQIKSLESMLSLTLIDRTHRRRPELTEAGRQVLNYANSIFETSDELLRWAQKGEVAREQVVRVGALSGLSRNLQYEFLRPTVGDEGVKVEVTTGDQEKLVRMLREHDLDVVLSSHNVRAEGKVFYYSHVLTTSPLVFVIRTGRDLGKSANLKSYLAQKPLFVPGSSFEVRPELDAYLESLKSPFRIAGEIDDIALLRLFALRSGAVVALPALGVRNDLQEKSLRILKHERGIEQRFYAITRERRFPNKMVESLILKMRRFE